MKKLGFPVAHLSMAGIQNRIESLHINAHANSNIQLLSQYKYKVWSHQQQFIKVFVFCQFQKDPIISLQHQRWTVRILQDFLYWKGRSFQFKNNFQIQSYQSVTIIQIQIMIPKYKEQAIPLISVDPTSAKYILTQEGQQFIRSVPGPIGVVSVAGLYRTGKSYLLNRMILNRNNGFGVGPTVNPCTKGLWCWGTPIKGESLDGQKLNIIVIDTEGIGALDEDQTHDTRIFTLAILASSCFIYNSTGSIDENAVQNLSLVVNLTKHIQINTSNNGEQDPDKIANYFPKFFWVVRDFSLQMVDDQGNQMNSKEYLEKALAPQKGGSEDIQQKNRIRKILTSFFKERECITLVRPLIDETKLQELDTIDLENLRPEFANKVIELRKSITKKMKPKTLNNQKLNGELYCAMLTSYIGAINEGAVPNIENAWHYMCQEQCTKILNESYDVFEKMIKDTKIPCSIDEINQDLERAQQAAMEYFKKQSIGEESEQFYRELVKKIKARINKLKSINLEEGKTAFKKYIAPSMNFITQKINKQEYENIESFIEEVQKFEEKVTKQEPKLANWELYLQLSTKKMLQQGSLYFIRKSRNEKEQLIKTSEQKVKINQKELSGLKKDKDSQQTKYRNQIIEIEKENIELKSKLEEVQFIMENTTKDKSEELDKVTKNLATKKKQLQQLQQEFQHKISEANKKAFEAKNQLTGKVSEWQKEKAVLQKQLEQNKQWISELENRKQTFDAKYAAEKNEINQKYGEQLMNEKNRVEKLTRELTCEKENMEELTKKLNELEEKLETNKVNFDKKQKSYRQQIHAKALEIERMVNQKQLEMRKIKNKFEEEQDEVSTHNRQLEEKLKKTELKSKEIKDELKDENTKLKHSLAIIEQKCAQLEQENQSNKSRIKDMNERHRQQRQAWETDRGMYQQQQISKKITEIQTEKTTEIREIREEHEKIIEMRFEEINNLTNLNNQYQLNIKLLSQKLATAEKNYEEEQERLMKEIENRDKKIKNMERQFNTNFLEKEKQLKNIISTKENELDELKESFEAMKSDHDFQYSQELTKLKNLHDSQKTKMELKHSEEVSKLKRMLKEERNSYENTLQEKEQAYNDEIETLETNLTGEIRSLEMTIQELVNEKDRLSKERDNFKDKYQESEQRSNKIKTELNEKYNIFEKQSKSKIEALIKEKEGLLDLKSKMEKENFSLSHTNENLTRMNDNQQKQINELKADNKKLKDNYESYKDNAENKLKEEIENFMKYRTEKETQIALLGQERKFLDERNKELEKERENNLSLYEKQLKKYRQQLEMEKKAYEEKLTTEKKIYEEKVENLKKKISEIQNSASKREAEASREIAVTKEKLTHIEGIYTELQRKYDSERQHMLADLAKEKQIRKRQKSENQQIIHGLEEKLLAQESSFKDQKNDYELKIQLSQRENYNLEQRLEKEKEESNSKIEALQRSLEEIKKKSQNEKTTQESTHQEIRSQYELRYREERSTLKEEVNIRTREIESLKKQNERLIKEIKEKTAFWNQEKVNLQKRINKIENEGTEKRKEYEEELHHLNQNIKRKQSEFKEETMKSQKQYKRKIQEIDKKCKQFEDARNKIMFQKETDEVKWNMEKLGFSEKIQELKDEIDKLTREHSKLVQQNQKYKMEKKKTTSQIWRNGGERDRTFIYAREIPPENKENTQQQ